MKKLGRKPKANRVRVQLRRDWSRSRCQARFRGEEWNLEFEDYYRLWTEDDKYLRKGRHAEQLCLGRWDVEGAWELSNLWLTTNSEFKSKVVKEYRQKKHG